MRAELRKDLAALTAEFKKALQNILNVDQVIASLPDVLTEEQRERPQIKNAIALAQNLGTSGASRWLDTYAWDSTPAAVAALGGPELSGLTSAVVASGAAVSTKHPLEIRY